MSNVEAGGRAATDNIGRAITFVIIAVLVFGIQDATAKVLVQTYSPFQITMMRFWAFAAFSLFLVSRQAPLSRALSSRHTVLQVIRGVLLVADIWFFALAVGTVPLPELQSISLIYPLLTTIIAIPVLGERVGPFRFAAVGVGFLGALIIVRPGGLPLSWGVLFAVASAACYSVYATLTRRVSKDDSTATSMVYAGLIGLVLSTATGIWFWQPMDLHGLLFAAIVMITTCVAHGLMIAALSMAPASLLQPFNYVALPWAILLSYVFFQQLIDPVSLIGAAIIVGAGLVVMARERHLAGVRARAAAAPAEPAAPPH